MKIKEKVEHDVAILSISGNMMGGPDTQELHEKVKSLLNDGIRKIVIDLKDVKWMNSSGLGTLMAALTSVESAGGKLKLANVTDKVQSLLMITQLMKIFETYESVDRACASFLEEK
jgi:anti-sigma B factor antagonist